MTNVTRRFRTYGRETKNVLQNVQDFLTRKLHLYKERSVFQKSGGRSGDLAVEKMEYEVFMDGSENGWNNGSVHVYSVTDDSTNGYAQHLSVLILLPDVSGILPKLTNFLDEMDFASNHSSFKERPFGFHSFRPYIDEVPELKLEKGFMCGE